MRSILILILAFFMMACGGPEDSLSDSTVVDSVDDLAGVPVIATGIFSPANGYDVTGDVVLHFNSPTATYSLLLNNFTTDNGPQLRVYLAQGTTNINILDLGEPKSTNGVFRYNFPASDFDPAFNHVLIWCELVGQSFGEAPIN